PNRREQIGDRRVGKDDLLSLCSDLARSAADDAIANRSSTWSKATEAKRAWLLAAPERRKKLGKKAGSPAGAVCCAHSIMSKLPPRATACAFSTTRVPTSSPSRIS